ncbi:hypothetical protein Bca52824_036052 [Brassica carinata]|uniref:Uncharacterized protein n=1 Tax=Brassica carinata TaxID=52824 RepID=A0A8X7V189_BRACI|nr:hypothetical protein Bca52824_036052 [Brassica carinata]
MKHTKDQISENKKHANLNQEIESFNTAHEKAPSEESDEHQGTSVLEMDQSKEVAETKDKPDEADPNPPMDSSPVSLPEGHAEIENQEKIEESPLCLVVVNKEEKDADKKDPSEAESESAQKRNAMSKGKVKAEPKGRQSARTSRRLSPAPSAVTPSSRTGPCKVSVYKLGTFAITQGPLLRVDLQVALEDMTRALQALTEIVQDLQRSVTG